MKIEEQYKRTLDLKRILNKKLENINFERIKELIQWTLQSVDYKKLKNKDNQLRTLDFFIQVWLQEMKDRDSFAMQGDIFWGVNSLDDLERKYLAGVFTVYRLENNIPYEYLTDAVDDIVEYRFSAFALYAIIIRETLEVESNLLKLARLLKERNELVKAIGLLQKGVEEFPISKELALELADCWLLVQQWKKAYECLLCIQEPDKEIEEMICELEKVVLHENI